MQTTNTNTNGNSSLKPRDGTSSAKRFLASTKQKAKNDSNPSLLNTQKTTEIA